MTPELLDAERICYVFVARVIAGFGIVGNLLSLFVLRRKSLNDSPYTYLTALAVADLLVLILMSGIGAIRCGNCYLNDQEMFAGRVFEYFIYLPIINMAHHSSTFITAAMTIERFVFVRYPFKAKKLCTRSKAKLSIFIVVLLAVGINLPRFFMFSLHQVPRIQAQMIQLPTLPPFVLMECTLPLPHDHETASTPYCILSGYETQSGSLGSVIMQSRVDGGDSVLIESPQTLQKLIDSSPIPVDCIQMRLCQKMSSTRKGIIEDDAFGLFSIIDGIFVPIDKQAAGSRQHYSERSNVPDSMETKYSARIYSAANKNRGRKQFSDEQTREIRVWLNITSAELLALLVETYPCLMVNNSEITLNKSIPGSTEKPLVIQATSPVLIQTTSYYDPLSYWVHSCVTIFEVLATITMATLNIALIRLLHENNANRQKLMPQFSVNTRLNTVLDVVSRQHYEQQRLTITLILITSLTSVATFVSAITRSPVAEEIFGDDFETSETYRWANMTNNVVSLANNSINFILYALFNTRFRKEFRLAITSVVRFQFPLLLRKKVTGKTHKCLQLSASNSSGCSVSTKSSLSILNSSRESNLDARNAALGTDM